MYWVQSEMQLVQLNPDLNAPKLYLGMDKLDESRTDTLLALPSCIYKLCLTNYKLSSIHLIFIDLL